MIFLSILIYIKKCFKSFSFVFTPSILLYPILWLKLQKIIFIYSNNKKLIKFFFKTNKNLLYPQKKNKLFLFFILFYFFFFVKLLL